jgi:hypothetical protein
VIEPAELGALPPVHAVVQHVEVERRPVPRAGVAAEVELGSRLARSWNFTYSFRSMVFIVFSLRRFVVPSLGRVTLHVAHGVPFFAKQANIYESTTYE